MPYIKKGEREELEDAIANACPCDAGQLNFAITTLIKNYLNDMCEDKASYSQLNEILGVLEAVKLEFYRRVVVSYEEEKIKAHGDVY